MLSAIKLGHIGIVAKNYQAMLEYYTGILGFELTEQTARTSYLRVGVDHHAVALHKLGEKPGLEHIAFQIDPQYASADAVKELSALGITARVESDADPSIPELVSFSDCAGLRIELYTEVKYPPKIQKRTGFARGQPIWGKEGEQGFPYGVRIVDVLPHDVEAQGNDIRPGSPSCLDTNLHVLQSPPSLRPKVNGMDDFLFDIPSYLTR